MQTRFTEQQLKDPGIAEANGILRKCVHCGFCTATCPTYVLLGDELDSPRGRIYLIKEMLESGEPATPEVVKHVDRCLSCLSCMSTCPSGVNYMHLVDEARSYIERTHTRALPDRLMRIVLGFILPEPKYLKMALWLARFGKPFAGLFKFVPALKPVGAMLELAPARLPAPDRVGAPGVYPAQGEKKGRVALLTGCAQGVLNPAINTSTIRLLNRIGTEVVVPQEMGCCGALTLHMGKQGDALARARNNVDAWIGEMDGGGLDAIIINTSGCGTTVKDYGHMLKHDATYTGKAKRCADIAMDVSEYLAGQDMPKPVIPAGMRITYHSACSLQHGQQVRHEPKTLLRAAGFDVTDVPEGHICCGSAGTYNVLQPDIANRLRDRKVANINRTSPQVIAAGNIGCMTQIASGTDVPVVHTVELLNWATGGEIPAGLAGI